MTLTTSWGSLFTRMISADLIATSVPAPMAMPMSACVKAGASLMPSPTIATCCPFFCNSLTFAALSSGLTSAKYWSSPSWVDTYAATSSESPVIIAVLMPISLSVRMVCFDCSRTTSAKPNAPITFLLLIKYTSVLPSLAAFLTAFEISVGTVNLFSSI